jgi:hypothetical protein
LVQTFNTLRGVAALSSDDVWAVGNYIENYDNRALIEHWDGSQWSRVNAMDTGESMELADIAAVSPTDIWTVGYARLIDYGFAHTMLQHWDGNRWSTIYPLPNIEGMDNYLGGVSAISSNDIWAVGRYGSSGNEQPLFTHYDGAQWAIVPGPGITATGSLASVSAVAANDVWAVGSYIPTVPGPEQTLIMHWDGLRWEQVPSPNVGEDRNKLWSVSAASANEVWAVGYYGPPGTGSTLILHWDGTQWSVMQSPNPSGGSYLIDVEALSSGDVWAVGNYTSGGVVHTLALRWDGAQWSVVTTPDASGQPNYLYSVDAMSPTEVWGVGNFQSGAATHTLTERFVPGVPFSDVHPTDFFFEAVHYMWCHGIISGYDDGTFRPYNNTTRGQLCKIVVLAEGWQLDCPATGHFSDVPPGSAFYCYIETAYAAGIISGYADGTFRPGNNVTRGQLCKIVVLARNWQILCPADRHFSDVPPDSTFYCFIETAFDHGIISGYADGTFRPGNSATRGQISKIVYLAVTNPPPALTPTVTSIPTLLATPVCGLAWHVAYTTTDASVTAVDDVAADDIWAVGVGTGGSRLLHWDGLAWSMVPGPNGQPYSSTLTDVDALSASDVWAVGFYFSQFGVANTLILHWDGSQWAIVPSPDNGSLYGVAALSANDIWAVGLSSNYPYRTLIVHWNGSQWSVVPNPNIGSGSNVLHSVAAATADDVWAVGEYFNVSSNVTQTLTLHWDSAQWNVEPSPNIGTFSSVLNDVKVVSPTDVWAVGHHNSDYSTGETLTMHWDGTEWSIVPSPNPEIAQASGLMSLDALASTDIWAVGASSYFDGGYHQATLAMHWDGTKWSIVPSPNTQYGTYLRSVAAVAREDVWAVGSNTLYRYHYACATTTPTRTVTPTPTVTLTPTSTNTASPTCLPGTGWGIVPSANSNNYHNSLYAVDGISTNDVWAVGGSVSIVGERRTLIEHWDGTQWTVSPSPGGDVLYGVAAVSANDVWAVGAIGGSTLVQRWNGTQWSIMPSPGSGTLYAATALSATNVWAVGNSGNQTLIERWDGTQWSIVPSPNVAGNNNLYGVTAISANDIWAVGSGGNQTLVLHWDGTQWSIMPSPGSGTLHAVEALSATNVWAAGNTNNLLSLILHWDGTQWSTVPSPSPSPYARLTGISAISSDDVWAVGYIDHCGCDKGAETLIEHWNGTQWGVVENPRPDVTSLFHGVTSFSANDIWAVGYFWGATDISTRTLTEHYGGSCFVTPRR